MSISEAKRLIKQGGVKVNGVTIKNPNYMLKPGDKVQIGKRIFATVVKDENTN